MAWTDSQLAAIQFRNANLLVSAGAGSGKTTVLTARVLALLEEGYQIDQMLILTFTNASSADMRDKIRTALEKKKEQPFFAEQLNKLALADISTFDSYIMRLVTAQAGVMGIERIGLFSEAEAKLFYQRIAQDLMESFYQNGDSDFADLVNQYCVYNDEELVSSIIYLYRQMATIPNKKQFLATYRQKYLTPHQIGAYRQQLIGYCQRKISNIAECARALQAQAASERYINHVDKLINYLNQLDLNAATPLERAPRFDCPKDDEVRPAADALNKKWKTILENLRADHAALHDDEALKLHCRYTGVLAQMLERFHQMVMTEKKKLGLFEYHDLTDLALDYLSDPEALAELKGKYRQIIVDETQDNNNLNEHFIQILSSNNLFCVGDIKQSIYRFRNANPQLFQAKYDAYSLNQGGSKIDFRENFRSRSEVTDFINKIFNKVMDNDYGGADYRKQHQLIAANPKYTANSVYQAEIIVSTYRKSALQRRVAEAHLLAKKIQELIDNQFPITLNDGKTRSITYRDIAILSYKGKSFPLIGQVFDHCGIPLKMIKEEEGKAHQNVALAAILKLIYCYQNEEYYQANFRHQTYALLRSYVFNYHDDQIVEFLNNPHDNQLFDPLRQLASLNLPLPQLLIKVMSLFPLIENAHLIGNKDVVTETLYTIIDILTSRAESALLSYPEALELLDSIMEKEIKMNETRDLDAVSLMTVHKSKGLEFPVVIIADVDWRANNTKDRFAYTTEQQIMVPVPSNDGLKPTFIQNLAKRMTVSQEAGELIRLFYVACTRTKEKLIIVYPRKEKSDHQDDIIAEETKDKYTNFAKILDSMFDDLKPYVRFADVEFNDDYRTKKTRILEKSEVLPVKIAQTTPNVALPFDRQEVPDLIDSATHSHIQTGIKIHHILETSDYQDPSSLLGKILGHLDEDLAESEIYRELPFIFAGQQGRMDLLVELPDKMIIIDYKLSDIEQPSYVEQLHFYFQYLQTKTDKNIELYLYSIAKDELRLVATPAVSGV